MHRPEFVAAGALVGLAGLHLLWATGSTWPLSDRAALSDAVYGQNTFPSAAACVATAAVLATGSALLAGRPKRVPRMQRAGVIGVVSVLSLRGVLGLVGRTDLIAPGSSSPRFRSLDRSLYSPLCLTLAALGAPAARSARSHV